MIARWLVTNIITAFIIVLWSMYQGYDSNAILIGKIVAHVAFVLFLINVNIYFVFLLIRKSKIRNVKVKLAKISKRMMNCHIPIAITASLLILFHAAIMIYAQMAKTIGLLLKKQAYCLPITSMKHANTKRSIRPPSKFGEICVRFYMSK